MRTIAPIGPNKKKITKIEECDKKVKFTSHELKYISEENSYKALVGCGGSNLNIHSGLSWKKRRDSVKNKLFYTFFSLVCGQNCLVPFNQLWHLFGSSAHKKFEHMKKLCSRIISSTAILRCKSCTI